MTERRVGTGPVWAGRGVSDFSLSLLQLSEIMIYSLYSIFTTQTEEEINIQHHILVSLVNTTLIMIWVLQSKLRDDLNKYCGGVHA